MEAKEMIKLIKIEIYLVKRERRRSPACLLEQDSVDAAAS